MRFYVPHPTGTSRVTSNIEPAPSTGLKMTQTVCTVSCVSLRPLARSDLVSRRLMTPWGERCRRVLVRVWTAKRISPITGRTVSAQEGVRHTHVSILPTSTSVCVTDQYEGARKSRNMNFKIET